MFGNDDLALRPIQFFALGCDCLAMLQGDRIPSLSLHELPSTHHLTNEEQFAKIALGWNEEGIGLNIQINQTPERSYYPDIERGDSVEVFIDTRDLKSTGFNTRFCHHFFFLPYSVDHISKGEKTHFRSEDSHPLCDPQNLECETLFKKNSYAMKIFIPSQCLYGYDPKQFDRLGFTYRINRCQGRSQHFSVVSDNFSIEQQPSLWGSVKLKQ